MPELPEVETTRKGIEPHLRGRSVSKVLIRDPRMRWPIQEDVLCLETQALSEVGRRAKYLLIPTPAGTLILHLGMSGSIRICEPGTPERKHDHFILRLDNHKEMRLHDPRRFGAVLWHPADQGDIQNHPRLKQLGPEPLGPHFSSDYLISSCKDKTSPIKQHIMNNRVVVGVGNIYASEALFRAGISPKRASRRIARHRLTHLQQSIREVLSEAIQQGGTTLRDFVNQSGEPGYFKQQLNVYGMENTPCKHCSTLIRRCIIGQRASYYCPQCQR